MHADATDLVLRIHQRLEWYTHKHEKLLSVAATAQMLSTMLYMKRFFPYSVWNILGGLDENGIPFTLSPCPFLYYIVAFTTLPILFRYYYFTTHIPL